MEFRTRLHEVLEGHLGIHENLGRTDLIAHAVQHKEALASACGALATWAAPDSTGRSPKDTYIVRRASSEHTVDWDSPNCIPMNPDTFEMLWEDACRVVGKKERMYVTDFAVGADPSYALPLRTVSPSALITLFADNMFRPVPDAIGQSVFAGEPFVLLTLPYDRVDAARYDGRLRRMPDGRTSDMAIAMDMDNRVALVYGSAYGGSNKKLIFTVMNYLLPEHGILPLHCSANEGADGDCALLLGLSGTGKTTLSADPSRALLGDDEHGWNDSGIANFEGGCYAKLINLRQDKEPEIHHATFHQADPLEHGTIIENCMMWPDGTFDVDDERLTPNSRAAFPLRFLSNIKENPVSGHPTTILFLTADANGVLPPVARLSKDQA
ncbi:MAG TPA: phosphoenolpyruvate carboxykinase (ATP), partial [Deferrisomatales bacterium]|nr:phosphoenolpyruvate carboxykinase (ATP) [Deferrisomatales bacterium]